MFIKYVILEVVYNNKLILKKYQKKIDLKFNNILSQIRL